MNFIKDSEVLDSVEKSSVFYKEQKNDLEVSSLIGRHHMMWGHATEDFVYCIYLG